MLLKLLKRAVLFAPVRTSEKIYFERIDETLIDSIVYDTPRSVEPPKTVLFPSSETVARYFSDDTAEQEKPVIILGVKACDAAALSIYDRVMLEGGVVDKGYGKKRDGCLIIGTDCHSIWPTCFCTKVGLKPTPETGVDLNLAVVEDGFFVEIKTQKGMDFFEEYRFFFRDATMEETAEAVEKRQRTISSINDQNKRFDYRLPLNEIVKGTLDSPAWKDITKYCVECGACNISCPSCTCFVFQDQSGPSGYERLRYWDACLKGGYAKVAGGANSRPILSQRYNNRIQCKFDYSFERLGTYTCTGCGRCIECCAAKIDMREALKTLEMALALSAKLE